MRSNKQQKKKEIKMTSTNLILTVNLRLQRNLQFPNKLRPTYEMVLSLLREGTFSIGEGGGGGPGLWRGGSLINFYKLGRVKPVYLQPGEGYGFFWQGKNYSMSLS